MDELYTELKEIIVEGNIRTVFQPIVCLQTGSVFGYEALSRGPAGSPVEMPGKLFSYAKEQDMLWDLELLCRKKAIERSNEIMPSHHLFINVDPDILNDPKFQEGLTTEFLKKNNISKEQTVFEITERTSVKDYRNFRNLIDYYRNQGYKIALDDTGTGYSGLQTVIETYPNFIKIDMNLIRNIDKENFKRLLIKQFYEFSKLANIVIIAEGIETYNELRELIDIGIPYGQGYLLKKPCECFCNIEPGASHFIKEHNKKTSFYYCNSPHNMQAGQITRLDKHFPPGATGQELINYFEKNPCLQGVPIVQGDKPIGLVMKDSFYAFLSKQYGLALYANRKIELIIDRNPLVVDFKSSILDVSREAMSRKDNHLYDYIIVVKDGKYYGIITVKNLLEKSTELELINAQNCNPLTKLPGNDIINRNIDSMLKKGIPFSIIYVDLDNFKPYNDVYGFLQGDRVLVFLADLLKDLLYQYNKESFLGHVGGDDFIIIIPDKYPQEFCRELTSSFDSKIISFYEQGDLERGFIISKDREGNCKKMTIISVSLAAMIIYNHSFLTIEEINYQMTNIKKRCKSIPGSTYIVENTALPAVNAN